MIKKIQKIDGVVEDFNISKLKRSIRKAGAPEELVDGIAREISKDKKIHSTKDIHAKVYQALVKSKPSAAARYSLKKALHSLGPTGYPFEKYIASIYHYMGYQTKVNITLQGSCVTHEMDVIARTASDLLYVECKYHQSQSAKSNVKIPLYVQARAEDLIEYQKNVEPDGTKFHFFIATNTKFTTDAVQYSRCKGLKLLSWEQPEEDPLPQVIDRYGLHPVSSLTCLTRAQSVRLIENGVVMVRNVPEMYREMSKAGLHPDVIRNAIKESEDILDMMS